jgi:hypothetical protein
LGASPRTDYTSETKPFFLTSEFLVLVLLLMGLGIGASTSPDVDARLFWILATVGASFYMPSRGIAKSGSRSRAWDRAKTSTAAAANGGNATANGPTTGRVTQRAAVSATLPG